MKKRDFFMEALQHEAFRHKAWVFNMFSVTRRKDTGEHDVPYLLYTGDTHYYFYREGDDTPIEVTDALVGEAPFGFKESVKLKADEVPNLNEDITSTYGNLLFNFVALIFPFGDRISYVQGKVNIKAIEADIEARLVTDPEYRKADDYSVSNPITVSEYLNFTDALLSLEALSQLTVPSASPKALSTDPNMKKRRDELLEQYKNQLHDPAIIAKIEKELIAMDKAWIKGDISEGFYATSEGKSYGVVRKKMHIMQGRQEGFGEPASLVEDSLTETWPLEKMPSMVNALREGVYKRGAETQLGGVASKTINRMFQNTRITQKDCESKLGVEHTLTEKNVKQYLGFYYISGQSAVKITEDNANGLIGKTLSIRSPMFCKTPRANYCETCMGEGNSQNPTGLASLAHAVGSKMMDLSMQAAHGKELKTVPFDLKRSFS